MRFQRLVAAAPFAFAVAALTHVVEFGLSHPLGGADGVPLGQSLLALLAFAAVATILRGAFLGKRGAVLEATRLREILAGTIGLYVGLEAIEGHGALINAGTIALLVAFAAVIRLVAGELGRRLEDLGKNLALALSGSLAEGGSFVLPARSAALAYSYSPATHRRGRAPPHSR